MQPKLQGDYNIFLWECPKLDYYYFVMGQSKMPLPPKTHKRKKQIEGHLCPFIV
jgi:hypothetical protein